MGDRHVMAVDGVAGLGCRRSRDEMGDDLVPEEIEVDPFVRVSSLRTAQQAAIEFAGFSEISNFDCQMEWREILTQLFQP